MANLWEMTKELELSDEQIRTLLKGDERDSHAMLPNGLFSYVKTYTDKNGKTREIEYDLSLKADALFPPPTIEEEEVYNDDDAALPHIEDMGKPGSKERIEALAAHYASTKKETPFMLTDDEVADRYIQNIALSTEGHLKKNREGLRQMAQWAREDEEVAA